MKPVLKWLRVSGWILGIVLMARGTVAGTEAETVVVAKVNGGEIYLGEVLNRLRENAVRTPPAAHSALGHPGEALEPPATASPSRPDQKALVDRSLEEIILFRLLMEEAGAERIPPPGEQDFRKAFPNSAMTLPNLASVAFQVNWVARVLTDRLVEKLMSQVTAAPDELEKVFAETRDALQPEVAQIRWIVLAEKTQAEEVMRRLQTGEEFGALARKVSIEKASGSGGGMVGTVVPINIHEEVSKVVFAPAAKPGLVPEPIQVTRPIPFYGPLGWYIVYVDRIIRRGETTLDQWKWRIEAVVKQEKARKLLEERLTKRRSGARIWVRKDLHTLVDRAMSG